jgi:hypothetical protein
MSGQARMRGYLVQMIVCLLDAPEEPNLLQGDAGSRTRRRRRWTSCGVTRMDARRRCR